MRRTLVVMAVLLQVVTVASGQDRWPDGSLMDAWFADTTHVDVSSLGTPYVLTEFGVVQDSTAVQTEAIQRVIDLAVSRGGGVVVVPRGTFLSGALFFRPRTHLHLCEGARLKGSDRIAHFPVVDTRIEGETCRYFAALINADRVDGFTITGSGTIDGNGFHYWQEFWIRRQWNPQCTNKDAQRPRLVYISNSHDVTVQGVRLVNSPFWTNHLYRCSRVRFTDCHIFAPTEGVKAPSSDAIDLDVCTDVVVRGCYMNVNDDAVVLKGGKGTFADRDTTNGANERVLIEHCCYGRVHGCLTLGSESVYNRNVVLRRCTVSQADRVLWLKMRPDTPQHYEYVSVSELQGQCGSFLVVRPWTQFFKPQEREDMPLSRCNDITVSHVNMHCHCFFDVGKSDKYSLQRFRFEHLDIVDETHSFHPELIDGAVVQACEFR